MSNPVEGWYPDPAGGPGRRWWDGARWTDFVDAGPAAPPAAQPPRYGQAPGYGEPVAGGGQPAGYGTQFGQPPAYSQPGYGQVGYGQAGYAPQATRFGVEYAGFWQRVAAYLIDGLIIGIPTAVIGLLLFWSDISDFFTTIAENPDANPVPSESLILRFAGFFLIALIASCAYNVLLLAARGATVGMAALRIHVVDVNGQNPSAGRALGRWSFAQAFSVGTSLIPTVGSIISLLDPLWMLWDNEKQTLHDKVAKTWVLKRQ